MQSVMKKPAQGAASAEKVEQNQTRRHRWHDQGQRQDGFHQGLARPMATRQQQRGGKAKRQDHDRAERRDPGGEPDDLPVFSGHPRYLRTMNPCLSKTFSASKESRCRMNFFAAPIRLDSFTTAIE